MTENESSTLPEEAVRLLVRHYGLERIRSALEVAARGTSRPRGQHGEVLPGRFDSPEKARARRVPEALESIREHDSEKHRLLTEFFERLKDRQVLPDVQDLRVFSQAIGVKTIPGKSRKAMLPALMRSLIDQPTERLVEILPTADEISEQQRQQGYSILTDKLLDPAQ